VHVAAVQVVLGPAVHQAVATALATPAEWVTHTASAIQNPATSGDSPISGRRPGVKEKIPLKPSSTFARAVPAAAQRHCSQGRTKSSSVKGSIDGMAEAVDLAVVLEVVQAHRHRPVGVAADPDAVHVLAEVQVGVLVAQDRHPDLTRLVVAPDQLGDLTRLHVLVGQRQQRDVHADHRADRRAPEAGARHDDVGLDHSLRRAHAGDRGPACSMPDHAGGALEAGSPRLGAPREGDHRARRLRQAVGRRVQTAEDTVAGPAGSAAGRTRPRRRGWHRRPTTSATLAGGAGRSAAQGSSRPPARRPS
jgi:hypothetical protein